MIHLASWLPLALLLAPQETGPTGPALPGRDPRQEIRRLFQEVERELSAIDVRLADAGAGEIPVGEVGDSGIEKLLRDSQQGSRDATAKMDRILELALQMNGKKGGGAPSDRPSPLDRPQDGTLDRESTPEAPRGKEEEKPEAGKEGEPSSPSDSDDPARNRTGEQPRDDAGDPAAHPEDSDPWGFLPQRAREVFRNQGTSDMPVQYRDWIDSYYRRLNTTRG
jgi:hypothetical protein